MIKNIGFRLFFSLTLVFFGCSDENEKFISYYPNGEIRAQIELDEDGEYHGLGEEYYEDGRLKAKTHMKHGKMHGNSIVYWPSGNVLCVETFVDGERIGESVNLFKDSTISSRTSFSNGLKQGLEKNYYKTGALKSHLEFNENKMDGIQKMFHKNGNLGTIGVAKKGLKQGFWYYFDQRGDTLKIEEYISDSMVNKEVFKESFIMKDVD